MALEQSVYASMPTAIGTAICRRLAEIGPWVRSRMDSPGGSKMLHDRRKWRPGDQISLKGEIVKILRVAAVIAVSLVALAACKPAAVDTTADEAAIKAATRDWVTAYTAGDADGVTALYADDAVVMPPGAPTAVGHDAIRAFIASDSAASAAAGVKLVINNDDTVVMSGDLAAHSGSYIVQDATGATVDTGMYMDVSQKKDGKWLMVRDTWNSNKASVPAAEPVAESATN